MNDEKPKYLANLPKERPGVYIIVALAAVLAIALYGALRIYAGTVQDWERRFNSPSPTAAAPTPPPEPSAAERIAIAQREHDLWLAERAKQRLISKCINGVAFRKLPDGGWKNLPGVHCSTHQAP
jgi:hypothetical protein